MTKTIRLTKPATLFALTLALGAGSFQPAAAATSFDGSWSVRITAENGDCSARYTIPIEVSGGRIRYSGPFNAKASGAIGANGGLKVSFAHSDDVVSARGSLKGESGYGSWTSPTKNCDGTWAASRG